MNDRYAIGIDVGGSHVCCAVVDLMTACIVDGTTVCREADNRDMASGMLAVWSGAVRQSIALSGVRPFAAGFAFPGPFDYQNGISTIRGVGKFENIFGLDVACSLSSLLRKDGIEKMGFLNDATAFALGESRGGAARDAQNAIVLTLGTGFGSGFVSRGKIVTSGEGVPPNGWVYCLPFEGGIADDAFSTRWFCKRYKELTGESVPGAKEIAGRVGEVPAAGMVFDEYGRRLGIFLAPLAESFGGDTIVLGGNISRAFPLFSPSLNESLTHLGCRAEVKPSTLRDRAAIIGAAMLFA